MRYFLSTVGTSILTNNAKEHRQRIYQIANLQEDEIDNNDITLVNEIKNNIIQNSNDIGINNIRNMSAELNGVFSFVGNNIDGNDVHSLILTDTWVGKKAGEIVKSILEQRGYNTIFFHQPRNLRTDSKDNFSDGIKNLLRDIGQELTGYRNNNYEIIFNLTGGFKGIQSFLNTFGMLHADKVLYVFETSDELLTIPRLPVKIDETINENWEILARIATGHAENLEGIDSIPDTLYETAPCDGTILYGLSEWGLTIWTRIKHKHFSNLFNNFPNINYANNFINDFNNAERIHKEKLNEVLFKISEILRNADINHLRTDGGIQYDNYVGNHQFEGEPLSHFRIDRNRRVNCVFTQGNLLLLKYGVHDYCMP